MAIAHAERDLLGNRDEATEDLLRGGIGVRTGLIGDQAIGQAKQPRRPEQEHEVAAGAGTSGRTHAKCAGSLDRDAEIADLARIFVCQRQRVPRHPGIGIRQFGVQIDRRHSERNAVGQVDKVGRGVVQGGVEAKQVGVPAQRGRQKHRHGLFSTVGCASVLPPFKIGPSISNSSAIRRKPIRRFPHQASNG